MSPEPQSLLDQVKHRAEQHAILRPERWRRLGFDPPPLRPQAMHARPSAAGPPRVSIVLATHRVEKIEACRRNIAAQDYPNLEVIIVLNNDAYVEASVGETFAGQPLLQILRVPASRKLGTCINLGAAHVTGAYIAKMDDDDFYGPSYISDLVLTALESGADIVGKKATFYYFDEGQDYCLRLPDLRNRWLWPPTDATGHSACPETIARNGSTVAGATLLVKREVIREFPFDESAPRSTDTLFQLTCRRAGMTTYASDEFNFCYMRHANAEGHLWQITKRGILKNSTLLPSFDRRHVCA